MMKLNHFMLMRRFWKSAEKEVPTGNEALLYFYLVEKCNAARWANPVAVSTREICLILNVTKKAVVSARKRLEERGLIEVTPGRHKTETPIYHFPDSVEEGSNNDPTKSDAPLPSKRVSQETLSETLQETLSETINKTNKQENVINYSEEDEGREEVSGIKTKSENGDKVEVDDSNAKELQKLVSDREEARRQADIVREDFSGRSQAIEALAVKHGTDPESIRRAAEEVLEDWIEGGVTHKSAGAFSPGDALLHLRRQIPFKLKALNNKNRNQHFKTKDYEYFNTRLHVTPPKSADRYERFRGFEPSGLTADDYYEAI